MNNDILRKAVELADGFELTGSGFIREFDDSGYNFIHFYFDAADLNAEFQFGLDALAAQLVRQVDALTDKEYHVDICREETWVGKCDSYYGIKTIKEVTGPDRTKNTIKAIVESAVLK